MGPRAWGFAATAAAVAVSAIMLIAGVSAGGVRLQTTSPGTASQLGTASGDPVVLTNWGGYGVEGAGVSYQIPAMEGSWMQPTVSCPTTFASEAIGAGLNAPPGAFGGKIDGVGTAVLCVFGQPVYLAWAEKGAVGIPLTGVTVHPGDVFQANVTTSFWRLTDVTTGASAGGTWTLSPATREAVCVVMRTNTGLGWPSLFSPLPPSNTVIFGSLFTSQPGCWFFDPSAGSFAGIGSPQAGYVQYTFDLNNPPGPAIVPFVLINGMLPLDSFMVP